MPPAELLFWNHNQNYQISTKNKCACMRVPGRDDAASSRLRLRSATHARTVLHYRLPVATKDPWSHREHREPGFPIAVASYVYKEYETIHVYREYEYIHVDSRSTYILVWVPEYVHGTHTQRCIDTYTIQGYIAGIYGGRVWTHTLYLGESMCIYSKKYISI